MALTEIEEEHLQINSGCPESPRSFQSDSSSEPVLDRFLSYLLERSPTPLDYRKPESIDNMWVFWSKKEESENRSSSADLHDKIKFVFGKITFSWLICFAQLWVPVTIGGRRLLSTSGQPFAVRHLSQRWARYRVYSEKYEYDIDVNKQDDPKIKSDGPATAFLNRLPYIWESESSFIAEFRGFLPICDLLESESRFEYEFRGFLPICLPSQSDCIGVLEITSEYIEDELVSEVLEVVKEAGLDVFNVQEQIPYKTINGLRPAKDEITNALEIVCESHNLILAQVVVAFEDKSHVPLSSYSEDTRRILGLKLTSYLCLGYPLDDLYYLKRYDSLSDVFILGIWEKHLLKTLQDFRPRYISNFHKEFPRDWDTLDYSGFIICLRSLDTGDFSFAFQFIWLSYSSGNILLEAILLTIKRCLPSFKFASGVELGDELDVIDVWYSEEDDQTSAEEDDQINSYDFKLFQGKGLSQNPKALEKGKQPIVVDSIAPSVVTCKTTSKLLPLKDMEKQSDDVIRVKTPVKKTMGKHNTSEIILPREDIEKHFDKPMKEAAKNLNVNLSTLKRKMKKHGIEGWPKRATRNKSELSINQIDANEEDSGAAQKPSAMIIKAEYADDTIKISHLNSQATFETINKEIGRRFNLSFGTYKLKYRDEDEDWILFTSDADLRDCIKCSRKSDRIVIRVRALPLTNVQI